MTKEKKPTNKLSINLHVFHFRRLRAMLHQANKCYEYYVLTGMFEQAMWFQDLMEGMAIELMAMDKSLTDAERKLINASIVREEGNPH
jgi:hypothetical protein